MNIEQVWPEWQVDRLIGKGSYGAVYRCFKAGDEGKEYAAVKVISVPQDDYEAETVGPEGMTGEQSREYYKDITDNFINEIKILEALKDEKHIVNIQDSRVVEKEDGIGWQIFIRMELLTDFNTYASDKTFTADDVRKLALDLCDALIVCGKKRIVHRDIKPENIFVDAEGNFKLGDFGVAKQLEKTYASMSTKGTYNYMAPEVVASKKYDSRADIYSLGLVMYKLLNNNRLPFLDPDKKLIRFSERQEAFERRIKGEKIPPIAGVDDDLNEIILKACEFRSDDRYRNVEEFRDALAKEKPSGRFVRLIKKHKVVSAVAFLLIASILSGNSGYAFAAIKAKTASYPEKSFVLGVNKNVVSLNNIGIVSDVNGVRAVNEKTGEESVLSDREGRNLAFDGKRACFTCENIKTGKQEIVMFNIKNNKQLFSISSDHMIEPIFFDHSDLYYFERIDDFFVLNSYSFSKGKRHTLWQKLYVKENESKSDEEQEENSRIVWYFFELVGKHPIIIYKLFNSSICLLEIDRDEKSVVHHCSFDNGCIYRYADKKYIYFTQSSSGNNDNDSSKDYLPVKNYNNLYIEGSVGDKVDTGIIRYCVEDQSVKRIKRVYRYFDEAKNDDSGELSKEYYNDINNCYKNSFLLAGEKNGKGFESYWSILDEYKAYVFCFPDNENMRSFQLFPIGKDSGLFGYSLDYRNEQTGSLQYEIGYYFPLINSETTLDELNLLMQKERIEKKERPERCPLLTGSDSKLEHINRNGVYCSVDNGAISFNRVNIWIT